MDDKPLQPATGGQGPVKPDLSVPSHAATLPGAPQTISREAEAEFCLRNTSFTFGTKMLLITSFLLTIAVTPAIQLLAELGAPRASHRPESFRALAGLLTWEKLRIAPRHSDLWHLLPRADEIKAAEKDIESGSIVSQRIVQLVQSVLTGNLRTGNDLACVGRDGWLFYRPDIEYVTGPPFLDPRRLEQRIRSAGVQPDPIKAIVDFRNQLRTRGIDLLVLPLPVKPCVDPEMLSGQVQPGESFQNASFIEFKARLEREGIRLFDPAPPLEEYKRAGPGTPVYLERDTHWRPETMQFVAQELAAVLNRSGEAREPYQIVERAIANLGDTERMLKLPNEQKIYRPQQVLIRQVIVGNGLWHPTKQAIVLLLGDSFSNIFSLESMGWGESAGLAEHLSQALGGEPLDCIQSNGDGSFATRQILSTELARGRDRLAGKKLVVWEFAVRELAFGDWKLLAMKLGQTRAARFLSLEPGHELLSTGIVEAVSRVPRPGTVPYKDHICTVHLVDLTEIPRTKKEVLQAVVYFRSMTDNVWTAAARLRPGERITVHLHPWADEASKYESLNRSEIGDPALQLEEPLWGEIAD